MAEIIGEPDIEKALRMLVYLYTDGQLEVTGITLKEQGGGKDASVLQHTAPSDAGEFPKEQVDCIVEIDLGRNI